MPEKKKTPKEIKKVSKGIYSINSAPVLIFSIILISLLSFFSGYLLAIVRSGKTANTKNTQAFTDPEKKYDFEKIAKGLGIDTKKFNSCLSQGVFKQKISDQQQSGASIGVKGTPASFVLNIPTGTIIKVEGARNVDFMKKIINISLGKETDESIAFEKNLNLKPIADDDHIRGNKSASVAIVVYSDLECPFCSMFHTTLNQLLKDMPNDIKVVFRHFPLTSLHKNAQEMAESSECAASIGGEEKFWLFADKLFETK